MRLAPERTEARWEQIARTKDLPAPSQDSVREMSTKLELALNPLNTVQFASKAFWCQLLKAGAIQYRRPLPTNHRPQMLAYRCLLPTQIAIS